METNCDEYFLGGPMPVRYAPEMMTSPSGTPVMIQHHRPVMEHKSPGTAHYPPPAMNYSPERMNSRKSSYYQILLRDLFSHNHSFGTASQTDSSEP
jgi:hypothetical protein